MIKRDLYSKQEEDKNTNVIINVNNVNVNNISVNNKYEINNYVRLVSNKNNEQDDSDVEVLN